MNAPTPIQTWRPIAEAPDHVEVITWCPVKCEGYRQKTINMRIGGRWIRSHERYPPTLFTLIPPLPAAPVELEEAA